MDCSATAKRSTMLSRRLSRTPANSTMALRSVMSGTAPLPLPSPDRTASVSYELRRPRLRSRRLAAARTQREMANATQQQAHKTSSSPAPLNSCKGVAGGAKGAFC